jgi:tetratricopeptide (TPR) repeat protein
MNARFAAAAAALALSAVMASGSFAFDEIHTVDPDKPVYKGTISQITRDAVKIEANQQTSTVPTSIIRWISFDAAPFDLKEAQSDAMTQGSYAEALARLERIKPGDATSKPVQTELEYFKLLCRAELARSGRKGTPASVISDLTRFIAANPQAYSYYAAHELLGHLHRAAGSYDKAVEAYQAVAQSPELKGRANVALGWTLLDQNKTADAARAFDQALAVGSSGVDAAAQRNAATLGKAACLAESGKPADAVKLIEEVIARSDAEDRAFCARVYNVLGTAHEKANQTKAAIMAYLRVDILYSSNPAEHAFALSRLEKLWRAVNQAQRSREAGEKLKALYPSSRWAQR